MAHHDPSLPAAPEISVIIAVYNDWTPLHDCLRSLAAQSNFQNFEVIVVDDGSEEQLPDTIRAQAGYYPLRIVRQQHRGISAARNRGIQIAAGSVLLFIDADSRLQANCLAALGSTLLKHAGHSYFQLRLVGDCSSFVGRSEELRLTTLQSHLRINGSIRYLNTAAFAVRRARVDVERGLFDPAARRGEDTLLLVELLEEGELPFFALEAVVQHATPLNVLACLRKDARSAYLEARTYEIVAARGFEVRISHRERLLLLGSMWRTSKQRSIGRAAWFLLVARQSLQRIVSFACRYLRRLSPPTPRSETG